MMLPHHVSTVTQSFRLYVQGSLSLYNIWLHNEIKVVHAIQNTKHTVCRNGLGNRRGGFSKRCCVHMQPHH